MEASSRRIGICQALHSVSKRPVLAGGVENRQLSHHAVDSHPNTGMVNIRGITTHHEKNWAYYNGLEKDAII